MKTFIYLLLILGFCIPSSHFSLGYDIKQNMAIDNADDDMSGSIVIGYHDKGNGNQKKIDYTYEYISKFEDSTGYIEVSMYNINIDWRFTEINENLQPFIRFGTTGILDFEVFGESIETDSYWWESDLDGGFLFGFGFQYDNNLILSFVKHDLNISDRSGSINENLEMDWYSLDFEITRMNLSYLF